MARFRESNLLWAESFIFLCKDFNSEAENGLAGINLTCDTDRCQSYAKYPSYFPLQRPSLGQCQAAQNPTFELFDGFLNGILK